ncbi:MAG: hypothetical protein WA869_19650 [Alloacidobacterium sp.]|jgi:hypothetical protein
MSSAQPFLLFFAIFGAIFGLFVIQSILVKRKLDPIRDQINQLVEYMKRSS